MSESMLNCSPCSGCIELLLEEEDEEEAEEVELLSSRS